jgi:SAM-dependent methyltransferase
MSINYNEYASYEHYLRHQKGKTALMLHSKRERESLAEWDDYFQEALRQSLAGCTYLTRGTTVLCLGARSGAEVRTFIELGCFAVGIDLLPTPENKYVLYGDFNDVQYADSSIDVIFTNALDHSNDMRQLAQEAYRILRPKGHFITDTPPDSFDNNCDRWASCRWDSAKDIEDVFGAVGLALEAKHRLINHRVFGLQLRFVKGAQ